MNKPKITIEMLNYKSLAGLVLVTGTATDDETGINMTGSGKDLHWLVKIGHAYDWCVYCHWATHDFNFIASQGDKVHGKQNIDKILDIDDEVWARYRH